MLLMRIRKIKPTSDDYCLSVPLSILPGLNADQHRSEYLVTNTIELRERLTSGVTRMCC